MEFQFLDAIPCGLEVIIVFFSDLYLTCMVYAFCTLIADSESNIFSDIMPIYNAACASI